MAVHPRPRGEHSVATVAWADATGSSPPTRGTPGDVLGGGFGGRFIPAHAGNTPRCARISWGCPVHPRPRGEHEGGAPALGSTPGSSPPTRGTPPQPIAHPRSPRFIPAHAGNTSPVQPRKRRLPVHPRPRGEHSSASETGIPAGGSSPPTRGTHQLPSRLLRPLRFIPAHAGNTSRVTSVGVMVPVHPRPRGEHALA